MSIGDDIYKVYQSLSKKPNYQDSVGHVFDPADAVLPVLGFVPQFESFFKLKAL
ncbi:MAG: hypothetical protein M1834_004367 [Cirrosporium novae-zelandiae]|nr:MAG: hypothetical protein M1834_004367 [Cirrosporium novae-zelandiae]